jgi:hypothetical protein
MSGKNTRKRRLFEQFPHCCFCGGLKPATTVDHVPPRACFPDGYAPEGFEFPACNRCNEETSKNDQIFGLFSALMDFDGSKMNRPEDLKKLLKLRQGLANNYPDALPDEEAARPLNRVGSIITPMPAAYAIPTRIALKDAVKVMGAKLTHALYFRETGGKSLPSEHRFFSTAYQPQRAGTQHWTELLKTLLPNLMVGARPNIKDYGDRFQYKSGYKEASDFFVYAAQFGRGLILWGIVCGPKTELPDSGPLGSVAWLKGACGLGASRVESPSRSSANG